MSLFDIKSFRGSLTQFGYSRSLSAVASQFAGFEIQATTRDAAILALADVNNGATLELRGLTTASVLEVTATTGAIVQYGPTPATSVLQYGYASTGGNGVGFCVYFNNNGAMFSFPTPVLIPAGYRMAVTTRSANAACIPQILWTELP